MGKTARVSAIGSALATLRKSAEMTLDDVAGEAGISVSYLSRAENGLVTPTAQWVQMVTQAIGERINRDAA